MAPLIRLPLVAALVLVSPVHADEVAHWRPWIDEASTRFGVPAAWIEQVMRAESGGHTRLNGGPIRSHSGAIGLMQLMPATWTAMRAEARLGNNPDDPHDNILASALYLRLMYNRFGYPGLFAAYNAGPGRYADWLAGRGKLPRETIAYLGKLGAAFTPRSARLSAAPRPPLFVVRNNVASAPPSSPATDPLFAIRRPAS